MQAPSKNEAEAWLEETGQYNQRDSQQNRSSDEEEHENLSENEEEVLEDSDEREEYNEEEEEDVDIEEQEEIEEESQEQQEEGGDEEEEEDDLEEVQEIQQQENLTEDKEHEEGVVGERRRGHKPSKSQLPYGSPVKRAHTTNDHRRHTSRALTSQREKSPFETTGKFPSDREMFKRLTGQSLSPTRSPEEFLGYYEKFCKGFLLKKEEELEKKRRQKEEDELAQLQDKPTLISRPQVKPYVPLLERTPLLNARREQEIEKIKREKEEKEQREFEELTFTPKINPRSKNLANSPTRERLMNVYLRTRHQFSQSPLTQRKVNRDAFHPKINPNSRNIVAMRDNASKDVVERLYQRADLDRAKKTELAKQLTPKFTPSLNKNTRKIAKQIEANYHNEQNETKRDKRKRSEVESHRTSSQLHNREESHLEQASDLELLDILKQFNSMLEQKNEGPINLQQLSTLMSSYAGKKKVGGDSSKKEQEYEHAEEDEEDENEEYEGQGLHEQIAQREMNTDRPVKNYRAIPVNEEDANPMFNIEKNLMHIQGSLQDLKENGGHSSQASSRTKTKKSRQHTDYNEHEHTEREVSEVVVQSKNSVGTRKKSATQGASERNTPARSQKSLSRVTPSKHDVQKSLSHVTPSKHDVNDLEESKHSLAPASVKSMQKEQKEDYSSPDAAKITKKRAQTTTKKTNKKIKTYTDQSPRFDNESHNQIKSLKDARSLNEMFSHTVGSKNSLEGWNSHVDVQDQIIEGYDSTRDYQQEGKARGHVVEHSFGNQRNSANEIRQEDQRNSVNEIRQEDQNYRSNHPAETSKPKSGFVKKTNVDRVKEKDQEKWRSSPTIKDQEKERGEEEYERGKASSHAHIAHAKNQGSQSSIVSGSVKKDSYSQKSSSKEKRGRDQEEKKHRKSTTSSKDQSKKSVNLDDMASKAGSNSKVGSEYHQEDRSNRPKSGKGSRKVSFDNKPASDSRRSSIYEEEEQHNNLAGSQTKGSHSGYKKGSHEQQHGQGHLSTFANKYSNKRQEHEHEHQHRAGEDDDEVHSSIHGTPKVRSGDYMSFSANTLDQQPSFDDHQPPQNERKLTDEYESDGNKAHTHNSKGNPRLSVQGSPSKQRAAQFEVVTTETIQIEPQLAPRFSYSMDGSDKAITTASSSGLKAMAEQIVKKFKAYDAQIKQTAREYKMSVSPPRTASPSPEHHDNVHELETKKEKEHHKEHREHKVFKSVEKNGGTAKSSRNDIKPSRNSIPGSLSSVQSGRIGKK